MISKYKSEQLLWARTAANASSGPEQLQMLQLQKQDRKEAEHCIIKRRDIYTSQATNSQSEQLVALGENSCKFFMWLQMYQLHRRQSIASSREAIFTPSYELTKRINSCKSQSSFKSRGPVQCACASASTVQLAFSQRKNRKSVFLNISYLLDIDACVLSVKMMLSPRSCK